MLLLLCSKKSGFPVSRSVLFRGSRPRARGQLGAGRVRAPPPRAELRCSRWFGVVLHHATRRQSSCSPVRLFASWTSFSWLPGLAGGRSLADGVLQLGGVLGTRGAHRFCRPSGLTWWWMRYNACISAVHLCLVLACRVAVSWPLGLAGGRCLAPTACSSLEARSGSREARIKEDVIVQTFGSHRGQAELLCPYPSWPHTPRCGLLRRRMP